MRAQGARGYWLRETGVITLMLSVAVFAVSCARTKPVMDLTISTDRKVIEIIRRRFEDITSMNATLNLRLSSLTMPELNAYLYYKNDGQFKFVVLMPTGMTLFSFEANYRQFTLFLPNGKKVFGNLDALFSELRDIAGVNLPVDPSVVREVMDFYGGESMADVFFHIENYGNYYLLNQLKGEGEISYPLRRWWISRETMNVVKKEVFSTLPGHRGEILFEVSYHEYRMADNISTPFEIVVNRPEGDGLLRMSFGKVEYNR